MPSIHRDSVPSTLNGPTERFVCRRQWSRYFAAATVGWIVILIANLYLASGSGISQTLLWMSGALSVILLAGTFLVWIVDASRSLVPRVLRKGAWVLLPCICAVVLGWRGSPSENLLGVQDEGYYLATALALVERGSSTVDVPSDPVLEPLRDPRPTQAQRAMSPESIGPGHPAYGYLFVKEGGRAGSVFPGGFPMLLASVGAVGGMERIFWTNTGLLLALASVSGLLAVRLFGPLAGLSTGLLVMFHPLHLWISGTAFAELFLATGFIGGVLFLDTAIRKKDSEQLIAAMAIAAFLPLIKFEGWLGTVMILGIGVLRGGLWRHWAWTAGLALVCLLVPFIVAGKNSLSYFGDTLGSLVNPVLSSGGFLLLFVGGFAALIIGWVVKRSGSAENPSAGNGNCDQHIHRIGLVTFSIATVFLIVMLWIRPALPGADSFYYWPLGEEIRSWREDSLRRLGWYFGLPFLVLGYFGMVGLALRCRKMEYLAIGGMLGVFFFALIFLAWDIRNNPIQPYAMRRFIGYCTPLLCLGIASVPQQILEQPSKAARVLLVTLTTSAVSVFLMLADPILVRSKSPYIFRELETLATSLEDSEQIIIPMDNPARQLATPLHLGFGLPIVPIRSSNSICSRGGSLKIPQSGEGPEAWPVVVLMSIAANGKEAPGLSQSHTFEQTLLRQTSLQPPSGTTLRRFTVSLLEPEPGDETGTLIRPETETDPAPLRRSERRTLRLKAVESKENHNHVEE